jgi:hypothetical protein
LKQLWEEQHGVGVGVGVDVGGRGQKECWIVNDPFDETMRRQ